MEVEIISKVGKANCLDYQLYNFLSDFRNIASLLPPEHKDKLECTADTCLISAQAGMKIELCILEREPSKLIKLGAISGKDFFIWVQIKQAAPYDCRLRITIKAEMNLMMKALSKKKLQLFADSFVDGICQIPSAALMHFGR